MREVIPIEFREGQYIRIKGIPHDLTEDEANRIANIIKAMVERSPTMKEHDFDGAEGWLKDISSRYDITTISHHIETIRHALTLAKKMQNDGLVLVPHSPTQKMINAVCNVYCESDDTGSVRTAEKAYAAMISAAQEGNDDLLDK